MAIRDVSMLLHPDMVRWPGSTGPRQGWDDRLDRGGESDASHWLLGSHLGTHVDAPSHFIPGAPDMGSIPLDVLCGPATVFHVPDAVTRIERDVVRALGIGPAHRRVLFRTSNSALRVPRDAFDPTFVAVGPSGAEALLEAGVRLVGIDYISIEPFGSKGFPTHQLLLGARVCVLEGLDLRGVPAGDHELHCLPLRLDRSEAAPARAILTGPCAAAGSRRDRRAARRYDD